MPESQPIDFDAIRRFDESLRQKVLSWAKEPWSWEDMVAQYERIHSSSDEPRERGIFKHQ